MLSKSERSRFNELRNRQAEGGTLSPDEISEVTILTRQIEMAERIYLDPATAKLHTENAAAEERIQALNALVEREERFAARLRTTLEEIHSERSALAAERQRLIGWATPTSSA